MMLVAAVLGALGLVSLLIRRTLLGVLIGIQLLVLGSTTIFVLAGASTGSLIHGHVFGLFITISGIAQIVVGYAFAVRLFYLRKRVSMEELRSLKH